MEAKETNTATQRNTAKRLSVWAIVVAMILMIPFLANAPWTASDFIFAGVVLFGVATGYELATRNMRNVKHRVVVGLGALLIIMLFQAWAAAGP